MLSAFASIRWRSIGSRLSRNIRIDGHAENMAHVMLDIDQFDQTEARLVRVEEQSDAAVRLRRATRRASGSVHHRHTPAADFLLASASESSQLVSYQPTRRSR
jgi:hypothetical protein